MDRHTADATTTRPMMLDLFNHAYQATHAARPANDNAANPYRSTLRDIVASLQRMAPDDDVAAPPGDTGRLLYFHRSH
jgi:hypothetical protein